MAVIEMKQTVKLFFLLGVIFSQSMAPVASPAHISRVTRAVSPEVAEAVKEALANEPVLQTLTLTRTRSDELQLKSFHSSNGTNGDTIAEISIADSSEPSTSANNLLAYRPNFTDFHQSGLAGVFLNIEEIFPCASGQYAMCRIFTLEEDGFKNGKAIIEAGDSGNHFRVFSSTEDIKTYGFAFQGCAQLDGRNGCMPIYFELAITCQLPRESCGTVI